MSAFLPFTSVIIADTNQSRVDRIRAVLGKEFAWPITHAATGKELRTRADSAIADPLLLAAFDFPFDAPKHTVTSVDAKWILSAHHVESRIKSLVEKGRKAGAILYGPQPPAKDLQKVVVTKEETVLRPEGLHRALDILAGQCKRKFWIEVAVNPPDPESVTAKPSSELELHFSLRGSDCAANFLPHESIKAEEALSLASEFRSWAKASHKQDAPRRLRTLAARVNNFVYHGGLRDLLSETGQNADIAICYSGRSEALAYPLDLVLLDAEKSEYLHKQYPVCWSVPRRDENIGLGYPVKRPEELRHIVGRMAVFAANAGGWASLANGGLEFGDLSNPTIEASEICGVIRENTSVDVPSKVITGKATFAKVKQKLSDANSGQVVFLHYCGHGVTTDEAGEIIDWGGIALPDGTGKMEIVQIKDVHEYLLNRRKNGEPIYFGFFNCCDLGSFGTQKARSRSMYSSILHGLLPIDILICQRWEVNDCLARHFAVAFYKEFFSAPARSIHKALWTARNRIEQNLTRRNLHSACRNTGCPHHGKKGKKAGGEDNFTWLSPVLVLGTQPF